MANENVIIEPLIKEIESLRQDYRQLREVVDNLNKKLVALEDKLAVSKKNSGLVQEWSF